LSFAESSGPARSGGAMLRETLDEGKLSADPRPDAAAQA